MKASSSVRIAFSLVSVALAASGCASGAPFGKSQPKMGLVQPQKSGWDSAQNGADPNGSGNGAQNGLENVMAKSDVTTPSLHISEALAKECGITQTSTTTSFDFDSVTLSDSDRGVLTEIAKCMTEGPLKNKKIGLVGRADARGEDEYNMVLGSARAASVYQYLHDLGVTDERVRPTSRGEMDATGTDEAGYAEDRRVDITEL
ncbi:MAG: OmpA family protein [Polyangiaceae bacterium]